MDIDITESEPQKKCTFLPEEQRAMENVLQKFAAAGTTNERKQILGNLLGEIKLLYEDPTIPQDRDQSKNTWTLKISKEAWELKKHVSS